MKKLISLILVLTLLAGILPVEVLAAEDTFTLSGEEVRKVSRKVGVTSGSWHEGMSWSDSMSAFQKYCYLDEFRGTVASPVKNRYVLAAGKLTENPSLPAETDDYSMSRIKQDVFLLESKLNYFIFDLDTEINAVSNAETLLAEPDLSDGERAEAYRRIRKAEKRLAEIDKELKAGPYPGSWESLVNDMNRQLDAFFDQATANGTKTTGPLKAAGQAAGIRDDSSFHIIILNTDEIGIEVRTGDRVAIRDAEVTISSTTNGVTVTRTGKTGSDGVVIFPAGYFYLDDHHRMYASLKVTKDGYRIWESESLLVTAGEGIQVELEVDNGEPYIQYITFRGVDVAHDTEHVYYTPENDADQSFRVGVHNKPGKTGQFNLTYTPAGSESTKTITRTVPDNGKEVTVLDLHDTWCSMLAPEELVTMEFHEKADSPSFLRDSGITTEKAIVEKPLKSVTGISSYIPGTSFDLDVPLKLPGLKNLRISMAFPWELLGVPTIHFNMTTSGDFVLGIGIAKVKEITDSGNDQWKTANSHETAQTYSDFVSGRKSLTDIAKASMMKDGVKKKGMDLFTTKIMASFCLMLNGQVTKKDNPARDEDPYQGAMDLFFSAALDGMVSFSTKIMAGPVPVSLGFDLSVGIQAGLDLPFTFTTTSGGFNFFDKWHHLTFEKENLDIIISPRVSLAGYAGVGVKGLAGVYVRGYVGLTLNLHIMPMNKEKKFQPEATLNAGVQVVAEFLFWSVKATVWEDKWSWKLFQNKADEPGSDDIVLSARKNADTADKIHYVEPDVSLLSALNGTTKYNTVQVGNDFYGFWIGDQSVAGVTRPWLQCAKIGMSGGSATFTPVDLPYLFVGNDGDYKLTDQVKVVDFAVTSTNDVPRHEGAFKMITVAVTFFEYYEERHFPNKDIYMTKYVTDFYNIVFFDSGAVKHYVCRGGSVWDQTKDSTVTGVSVSLAFDTRVGHESGQRGGEHANYYYCMMYTMTTSASPTVAHYGVSRVYLTPGRPVEVLDEFGFSRAGDKSYDIDFNTSDHRIDEIVQLYAVARGVGTGNNDVYVLATLTGTEDEEGRKQSILIARDAIGDLAHNQDIQESTLTGDISSFRYIQGTEKEAGLFALVTDRDETGRFSLKLTDHRFGSDGRPRFTPIRDVGVRIGPACFDLVDLGQSRALYYLESLSTDGNRNEAGYNIRAIYLAEGSDGKMYASRSFPLASFRPSDVSIDNGVSFLKLYADDDGFIQGFLTEKVRTGETVLSDNGTSVIYSDRETEQLKYFTFHQTLQAEVLESTPEQTLVKPGDTINVLFSLMNTGNIPASKVTLRACAQKKGSLETFDLATIIVNCENPLNSRVVQNDTDMPDLNGYEAVSSYDTNGEPFILSDGVYATDVLMPDDTFTYRTAFNIPADFTPGQYEIYVTFQQMTTKVRLVNGRYDAVSTWTNSLKPVDQVTSGGLKAAPGNDGDIYTLSMVMVTPDMLKEPTDGTDQGNTADSKAEPLGISGQMTRVIYSIDELGSGPNDDVSKYSAFATSAYNDCDEIPVDDADLSVRGRLSLESGTEMVHVVLRNEGVAEAKDIVFTAFVDEEKTYTQSLSGVTLMYEQAASFDIPLSEITGGKEGENLILKVDGDSVETNLVNNEDVLPLNMSFMIIRQPADAFITEGGKAEFSVRARGGKKPYRYQWQVSTSGQYGPFKDIKGETGQKLKLTDVPYKDNGQYYRVVITDTEGRVVTSNPALLVVTELPPTGDRGTPWLWLGLLVTVLPVMAMLTRKKKHD